MKNPSILILLLTSLLLSASGCEKDERSLSEPAVAACDSNRKIVKKSSDVKGFVHFNQFSQEYALYAGVPGTIDSEDIGLPCNLPEEFKKEGLKVKFSGKYRDFGKQPSSNQVPIFVGQVYYYLELSQIQLD